MYTDSINRLDTLWCRLARIAAFHPYIATYDIQTYCRRSRNEGDEFRIRCLASLRGALLAGLQSGSIATSEVRFGLKKGTHLPRFMYGAWITIFFEDGTLRANYDALAVSCINQLTAVFCKLPGSYPSSAEDAVIATFVENERFLSIDDGYLREDDYPLGNQVPLSWYLDAASRNLARVLCNASPRDIMPKHGSGSSACNTVPFYRYGLKPRYDRQIDRLWSYAEFFVASAGHLCDTVLVNNRLPHMQRLDKCAKVLLVPKDYRGPRLISAEPRELMYIQQGLMWKLYNHIETHPATRGLVNFTDQSINQRLAHDGSLNGTLATLDLKDASDLISMRLVRRLFPTEWRRALSAVRSNKTLLPDGRRVRLHKHAPMGSACCFPVMALVIWAVSTAVAKHPRKIRVYGDDLICHVSDVTRISTVLTAVGLRLNARKCFSAGPFRESCGKEYCGGTDVTPVYLRDIPTDGVPSQVKLVTFANQIRDRYQEHAGPITDLVRSWYAHIPTTKHRRDAYWGEPLYWLLPNENKTKAEIPLVLWDRYSCAAGLRKRWNRGLHVYEFQMLTIQAVKTIVKTDCWGFLHRSLLLGGDGVGQSGMATLPKRNKYKIRWRQL